jgi:hypothetical protein
MIHAIPNPKKEISVNQPIDIISNAIKKISFYNNKYSLINEDDLLQQYKFSATEFLSLGVIILIDLDNISDEKTKIQVEIQRAVGTFNQSHEVTLANKHMSTILEAISYLVKNPDISLLPNASQNETSQFTMGKVSLICFFFGILGIHRFYTRNYIYGLFLLFTLGGLMILWAVDLILLGSNKYRDGNGRLLQQSW